MVLWPGSARSPFGAVSVPGALLGPGCVSAC